MCTVRAGVQGIPRTGCRELCSSPAAPFEYAGEDSLQTCQQQSVSHSGPSQRPLCLPGPVCPLTDGVSPPSWPPNRQTLGRGGPAPACPLMSRPIPGWPCWSPTSQVAGPSGQWWGPSQATCQSSSLRAHLSFDLRASDSQMEKLRPAKGSQSWKIVSRPRVGAWAPFSSVHEAAVRCHRAMAMGSQCHRLAGAWLPHLTAKPASPLTLGAPVSLFRRAWLPLTFRMWLLDTEAIFLTPCSCGTF